MRLAIILAAIWALSCAPYKPTQFVDESFEYPHPCGVGNSPQGTPGMRCPERYACRHDDGGDFCEYMGWNWPGPGN